MRVESIFENKENVLVYMERYVNDGSPSGFDRIHTSSIKTSPRGTQSFFNLPIIQFDETIKFINVGSNVGLLKDRCIFCHPDNLDLDILKDIKEHWKITGYVTVAPTASARTVKLLNSNYFIKLDYIGYLGRIRRNLDYSHILSAHEVTRDICNGILSGKYNEKFGVLKENKGCVAYIPLKDGGYYEFGCLIRESSPFSKQLDENLYLIPAFSLFGRDYFSPDDERIIVQLYRLSDKNINDFALNDILYPIIDCYFDTLVNHGLAMESHAQNTLIAINTDFEIKLIVSRDMESVDKDLPLRKYLNLNSEILSTKYKCIRETDYNYTIKHSFMFDFKLGEYLLNPLISVFSTVEGFNSINAIKKIREHSNKYIRRLPENYFPPKWYSYANEQFEQGKKRPYISHEKPKFR